jgi:hypothetical protein
MTYLKNLGEIEAKFLAFIFLKLKKKITSYPIFLLESSFPPMEYAYD